MDLHWAHCNENADTAGTFWKPNRQNLIMTSCGRERRGKEEREDLLGEMFIAIIIGVLLFVCLILS